MHLKNILPEEILLEIFSEIDKSELRKLFEISSEWRNLLIKNVKVMRKLPLILMSDTWREKMKFVEKYGKYIRKVEFIETSLESFEDVMKVLRLTPNVEKLSMINVKLAEKENVESDESDESKNHEEKNILPEKINLKRLEEIIVEDDENFGSMSFILSHCEIKLKSLKCSLNHETQKPVIEQLLIENCHLKNLEIFTNLDVVFNPSDEVIEGLQLQLNKLEVKAMVMKYNEQFMKFLTSQSHLKEIGLNAHHVDFRYQQMMFTTFPCVENIHLNIDALGTTDCLMKLHKIPANKSLKSLTLFGKNRHLNVFDAVLRLCPKISQLNVRSLSHFYSDKIKTLPLTHLLADCVHREYLKPANMTYLNKLQFTDITKLQQKETYERNLQNFCDMNKLGAKNKSLIEAF